MEAEFRPRRTVAEGSTINFLADLVVKSIRADASDLEMFECARNSLSTLLSQTSTSNGRPRQTIVHWIGPPLTADEWKPNSIMGCTLFRCFHRESLHTSRDISLVEVKMQLGLLLHRNDVLIGQRSASRRMHRPDHDLNSNALLLPLPPLPLLFLVPFSLSSLFTLGLSDPLFVAGLFGCLSGCSPDSTPPSGATHVWSVIDSDPPCVLPPCHVSF